MKDIDQIIKENLYSIKEEQIRAEAREFDEFVESLDDSAKSNFMRILLGKGIASKEKDGKIKIEKEVSKNKVLKDLKK